MKFTCERCGKKYATAEDPAPGRVYKLKCKACGHLIVVKASAGASSSEGAPAPEPQGVPEGHPAATPEIQLEIAPPEPAAPPAFGTPPPMDATTEVSMAGLTVDAAAWRQGPPPPAPWEAPAPEAPPAPAPTEGYVDLFGDGGAREAEKEPKDDPFLAAARASLPDGYGAGSSAAPDPLGSLREELAAEMPRQNEPAPYRSTTRVPAIPKPAQQKSAMPLVLIGAGALVLVGILGFVLLRGKKAEPAAVPVAQASAPASPAPAPPAPPPQAPPVQEAPPQTAEPATPPPAQPKAAAPAPKPSDDARRAAEERRRREREEAREREAQAKAEREARDRAAREARERDRLEREQRAREAREAQERARREAQQREAERVAAANIPVAESGLTQAQIEKVLLSTKKAFDSCIEEAKGSGMKLDGRRVLLRLNIQTSGAVTYPTLDDVTLNSTDLGSCLKSAARLMVFPKFKGDTMHVEVPLVLR